MLYCLIFLVLSCQTVERRLDPVFKGAYDSKPLDEQFIKTLSKVEERDFKKLDEHTYYFYNEDRAKKFLKLFKGYDLSLDIDNYTYKLPKKFRNYDFPESIIFNDSFNNLIVLSYDFKTKRFLETFRLDDYNLKDFDSLYFKVFKDLNGSTTLMINELKKWIDSTSLKTRPAFYLSKIGFKKSDIAVNKGYITNTYLSRDVSGIYSGLFVETRRDRYSINFLPFIKAYIEDSIKKHTDKYYAIYDLFFDEYEESPYLFKLKESMFFNFLNFVDLFESMLSYYMGDYHLSNPYSEIDIARAENYKGLKQSKIDELVKGYEDEVEAFFFYFKDCFDELVATGAFPKERMYKNLSSDKRFKYLRGSTLLNTIITNLHFER